LNLHKLYIFLKFFVFTAGVCLLLNVPDVVGQPADSASAAGGEIKLHLDGKKMKPPVSLATRNEGEQLVLEQESREGLIAWFYRQGFLSATIDSLVKNDNNKAVYAAKGCQYKIGSFNVIEDVADSLSTDTYQPLLGKGESFSNNRLEQEIQAILGFYEERGYPLVEVRIRDFEPVAKNCRINITLLVHSGEQMRASGVLFPTLEINNPDYIETVTSVKDSSLITPELMENSYRNLENTELFKKVEEPDIVIRNDKYYLQYNLEEKNPNSFDGLLGLVPDEDGGNTVVGDLKFKIRNVIWDGSTTDFNFRRLQDLVTRLNLGFEKDWIFGAPFGAGAQFNFLQQDTSYQVRDFVLTGSYSFNSATKIVGSLRRETAVANDDPDLQVNVLDAQSTFAGLGFEFNSTDDRISPTRGIKLKLNLETGVKDVSDERAEADSIDNRLSQRVFNLSVQPFIPLFNRTVLTSSVNAFVIQSDQLSESDLIRFGGARTLRGFREDQFMASRMFWGDLEYRYRLDPTSYAFVFGAVSTFERPRLSTEPKTKEDEIEWVNSWGFGMTFTTPLGLMQFSYAISSENSFDNGVVHFGIIADI